MMTSSHHKYGDDMEVSPLQRPQGGLVPQTWGGRGRLGGILSHLRTTQPVNSQVIVTLIAFTTS